MVLIGFGLAAIYWLLDSFLSIFLSYDHFLEKMLGVDLDNVWGRVIVLCLFTIFGSHAQFTINERRKAAEKGLTLCAISLPATKVPPQKRAVSRSLR